MFFSVKYAFLRCKIKKVCKDSNFFSKKLAHIKKKQYFCTRNRKTTGFDCQK